jgi:hypothetical protein
MKKLLLLLCLAASAVTLSAQRYSKVKIRLDETHGLAQLAQLGIEVEHGHHNHGIWFIGEYSEQEVAAIQQAGFSTEILIPDLKAHLLEGNRLRRSTGERSLPPCTGYNSVETPANYSYGSMAGYQTYQEMLDELDKMAALYPTLFKAKEPISQVLTTFEGRPIYWVKISDNPSDDETGEPEIFFNALHHAREPNSMSQMLFFMWHLLENYDTDPEIKFLVDHTEIYFVPCVNPDGYIYNETTNPDGGGFWRKNRRPNADGSIGVDLNRNYGFNWAYNNDGSSGSPNSEVYRGTAPFSEPETQMMRQFSIEHEFAMVFNYHTFSDLLLHSWDYDWIYSPDHDLFLQYGEYMTEENQYQNGISPEVLYPVNGGANDWQYGEQVEKGKSLSFVPEVGYTFWPFESDIDRLNKDAFFINLKALRLLHDYGKLTPFPERLVQQLDGQLPFELKKFGTSTSPLTVTLTPVSSNIASVSPPKSYTLGLLETTSGSFDFLLKPDVQSGDEIEFEISVSNGSYAFKQSVKSIYGSGSVSLFDPADDLSFWDEATNWETTNTTFYSAPTSITDSKGGPYPPNQTNLLLLDEPVTVSDASAAFLSFWARWSIEDNVDYAQVSLSVNGGDFVPLCGKYTKPGIVPPVVGQPVYDGQQNEWVQEEIDLSEYLQGATPVDLSFSFSMTADGFNEFDGFYFDDLKLTLVADGVSSTQSFEGNQFSVSTRPNPASGFVVFDLKGSPGTSGSYRIEVFNALGQPVRQLQGTGQVARLDVGDWAPGVYFYQVENEGKVVAMKRFVVG